MAERSTAAVDVADTSGDQPLSAVKKAATDGTETDDKGGTHSKSQRAESGSPARDAQPLELHSGHKLARRYRLEECVTRLEGFSSWRAVDEKLRRAVGVHLLPADHPRARPVLAAARSSALLGDPRFVQVLDAVEENDLVYVVHEWLPDATELTPVLSSGPLEPHEAYQLVSQVSQAMAAAHREGLAHLRLNPGSVLRTVTGQYRIRGLAVMAALRGISSDNPQRTDTEAIGALLYAALTQRWPYEGNAHGLPGLPKGVGLIAPDQVRAGVHRGLSELAMRALGSDKAQEAPCTTPEELAKAVSAMPRIRPPEPDFTTPPPYPRVGAAARPGSPAQPVPPPPPAPLEGRTGRALKWSVSALLIAALGLGSWQIADALLKDGEKDTPRSQSAEDDASQKIVARPLQIASVAEFSPLGPPTSPKTVQNSADGNPASAWITGRFDGFPNFGNLPRRADGSGIIVDLGNVQSITEVDVIMYRPGQTVEILAADPSAQSPSALREFTQRITELKRVDQNLKANLHKALKSRYVLIHVTELPPDGPGSYRGGIAEIKALGLTSDADPGR
ncbi:serine/threonine protein kinase [Streptomyces mashuensis]|uniref:Serine/threonine protein kinase n=1 Tax=Streptomyces mashuensis TaxID=33904 RepID=A0A919B2G9_9ACTN|nr:protein kinase family protein [Streptomyces mashuensis]GHF43085.1 serine/threonine protein kinase [Streptomyces mashuensis]